MPTTPARPKLVVLDRDGVINQDSPDFVKSPDEWIPLPGALEAIARINQAGYRVVVATNQSGLGRGLFDAATLNAIHAKLRASLAKHGGAIDAIFVCPHAPDEGCDCRKPLPGLYREIARRFEADLHGVPSVGDSARDLEAAAAAGCTPWLVLTGNGPKTLAKGQLPAGTVVWNDLGEVADALEAAAQAEEH
ncbi:D-glycero-beta-D-manno-heptose 1,7-bisphosphate 7-phosphatase [Pigmentiphaga sp. GD03639]|jgi:D-glycero-D-manno-heptose 1,7-bisphosphate phosphatase|uniref:D,D-heptose 1,7-bisphosphate phosphatase n=1 Tax=Pigmentiphaga daeguensis TaxID=414049 RepID=A0ABN1BFJ2_9BURK|nr:MULTISPECIES: D-glycero-beta-D-manno-heptose 1,7-bisphosphate 7-phosphatase [unclassified Pigmentiphaga]MDH2240232.1 D-glycero-beta-D-manno-heptose 1,7-bisphosphate 7-phosphatase [Pigmentiphaga sp. GD03639]OVZ64992.1 D-glycero-beta-D-manno-heptose-1,7-bisphosphate 7-phosphatase [Pigmentiphaga sp. NML030171]